MDLQAPPPITRQDRCFSEQRVATNMTKELHFMVAVKSRGTSQLSSATETNIVWVPCISPMLRQCHHVADNEGALHVNPPIGAPYPYHSTAYNGLSCLLM